MMQRIGLLVLGMASLVASGVVMDRARVSLNAVPGLGLQTVQGIRGGTGFGNVLSKDDLLRQKFILDILNQIYMPLQQQDLLLLDDRSVITNEDLYLRPLTQEMQVVLELIQSNQMLSKQAICSLNNKQHVYQTIGLYRLLVTARDFDTFKRLVVYARQNVNNEMFVFSLILALGERPDTQMLIVPALYEILPQLFIKDQVIDQVRQLDTGVSSLRPQLMDVVGSMGRRNLFLNSRFGDQQQQQGGLLGVLNRSQLWMPWRDLHKQMALRKMAGGNLVQQDQTQFDKVVISVPGNGLLSQDIGLKAYVGILIDELVLNQDALKNLNRNYGGIGGLGSDTNDNIVMGRRGQMNVDDITSGITRNRVDNDLYTNRQYGNVFGGQRFNAAQEDINSDRLLHVGRRSRGNNFELDDDLNSNIYGGVKQGMGVHQNFDGKRFGYVTAENDVLLNGRRLKNSYELDEDQSIDRNLYLGNSNIHEGQGAINTVSVNDPRLLFVGRRRKNPNSVVNIGSSGYGIASSGYGLHNQRYGIDNNRNNEDYFISGGRHVANELKNNGRQGSKYNRNKDQINLDDDRYVNIENVEDDLYLNKNRAFGTHGSKQNYQSNDEIKGNFYGRNVGAGMGIGRGRNDFLNVITRGRVGQKQYFDNDQDVLYNQGYFGQNSGESLDKHLPTTNINDERLLHINRHRLNNAVGGHNANNMEGDIDDDVYDHYNAGYQGGNIYMQPSYLDDQSNVHVMSRGYQNYNLGDDAISGDSKRGHRYRRSIVNQNSGQTNTINGRLVLHSLQQLVARLNIERIALGKPLLIDTTQNNNFGSGILANNLVGSGNVAVQTINKIENIIQHIDQVLQQQIGQITIASYNQKVNQIGLILAGQIQDLALTNILGDILEQTNQQVRKGLFANVLENEAAQILLAGVVKVVDQRVQQVFRQREEFMTTTKSVALNNVVVDKLQTFVEQTDIDLSNLLNNNNNVEQIAQGNSKIVVGRVPRLNHKAFNIEIDVTSERQQQVVVRNLLVPRVDGQNNVVPLVDRRQNVIVLDISIAELQQGRNSLKISSKDSTITSRDTTPLTKIYQIVMQALQGGIQLQQDLLAGQTTLLPHRLLLPRGRASGLPMKLITVITPLHGSGGIMGIQKVTGLNALLVDNLPLDYPLHCDITDVENVALMPNLMVQDVKVYHEDNIKLNFLNTY